MAKLKSVTKEEEVLPIKQTFIRKPPLFQYDVLNLRWNEIKTVNEEGKYCYCGMDRRLDEFMMQCCECHNWFHESCVMVNLTAHGGPTIPFLTSYEFICAGCGNQQESFQRLACAWKEIATTVVANLMMQELKKTQDLSATNFLKQLPQGQTFYFVRDEIVDFIDLHWLALWGNQKSKMDVKWKSTLSTTLYQYREVFINSTPIRVTVSPFTLFDQNLLNVRPGHVHMFSKTGVNGQLTQKIVPPLIQKARQQKETKRKRTIPPIVRREMTLNQRLLIKQVEEGQQIISSIPQGPNIIAYLPQTITSQQSVFIGGAPIQMLRRRQKALRRQEAMNLDSLPQSTIVQELLFPYNRDGFKYQIAEPNFKFQYVMYKSTTFVKEQGNGVFLSRQDCCPAITLNQLTCSCPIGFRAVRANIGVTSGHYYFEVMVNKTQNQMAKELNAHVRIGMSRRESTLLGPVGYDCAGYSIRDKTGEKVHCSRPMEYSSSFHEGDVIGVEIFLPERKNLFPRRKRTLIRFNDSVYFESKDYFPQKVTNFSILKDSRLVFYKNGLCLGVAFENLPEPVASLCTKLDEDVVEDDGSLGYYPSASCYNGGSCTFNFGPNLMYSIAEPYSNLYSIHECKELIMDLLDEVESYWKYDILKEPKTINSFEPMEILGLNYPKRNETYEEYKATRNLQSLADASLQQRVKVKWCD